MEKTKIICSRHKKEIIYVCFNSAWHCEIMCCDCLPAHSENHVKNNTVSKIENFDLFLKKYLESLIDASTIYDDFLQKLQCFLKIESEILYKSNEELEKLKNFKNKFLELENFLKRKIDEKYENNKKSIDKVEKDILSLRNQVERHIEI